MPYTAPSSLPAAERVRATPAGKPPKHVHGHVRHKSEPSLGVSRRTVGNGLSSRSYMYRHRRSPTVEKSVVDLNSELQSPGGHLVKDGNAKTASGSTKEKSSDDQRERKEKDRQAENMLAELGSAVMTTDDDDNNILPLATAISNSTKIPEADDLTSRLNRALRGGVHKDGRVRLSEGSSREPMLGGASDIAVQTPERSNTEDWTSISKRIPMIRKKSGELVRPALRKRPSSMPGTPTFVKAVHFDSQDEVRHFGEVDRPAALSVDSSPTESHCDGSEFPFHLDDPAARQKAFQWEAQIVNLPADTQSTVLAPVRLDRVFVSPDSGHLVGVVTVANLAFHKHVVARFTLDYWKTVSEVTAEYADKMQLPERRKAGEDTFVFNIDLAGNSNLDEKRMFICIRYNVNGLEFWDNNRFMNYHVKFTWKLKSKDDQNGTCVGPCESDGATSALEHATPVSPLRSFSLPSLPADLVYRTRRAVKMGATAEFPPTRGFSSPDITNGADAEQPTKRSMNAFGNRYNVGASLSAAMQPRAQPSGVFENAANKDADDAPGSETTTQLDREPNTTAIDFTNPASERRSDVRYASQKPSDLMSDKPDHQSPGYKELVDKYCFYGSSQSRSPPKKESVQHNDEAAETSHPNHVRDPSERSEVFDSSLYSVQSSSPVRARAQDLGTLERRTASPSGRGNERPRSSSPRLVSGYSRDQPIRSTLLTNSPRPTAILG